MSFPSATSYSEANVYGRKVNSQSSGSPSPLFASDSQMFPYYPDSPQVSSSSPYQPMNNIHSSFLSENSYNSNIDSPLLSNISNDMEYDENDIKMKLQELERALLSDDNDMEDNWADPIKELLSNSSSNSPKESSSESNISSVSITRTPKTLLFDCALAISEGNINEASGIISELRQLVSIQGDPPQRLAAYLVEGLVARMASSGQGLYNALKCKEPDSSDRLSAMQILFEVCPCFKFGFMAANGAILEACKDETSVHIIDFDINQGSQYYNLIQDFSKLDTRKLRLRITGVDDPESVQRKVGGLEIIGKRLEKLAEDFGVSFKFKAIAAKVSDVTPSMLDCCVGEALVVNFAFQLHHMPDESVSTVNQRDHLLRMVKSLKPKLVTVVEQDVNTNTAPFFPRFVEVYNYYLAVFESLDATIPRESPDRMNVEKQCLARDIVNIVACEGADRIERYEAAGKWRARMNMAGFESLPLSSNVNETIKTLLMKSYGHRYKLKVENGSLYFGWEDKILVVASAWK